MRILFCNYEYPPLGGGGGVSNALLARELAREHEVAVLTSQGGGAPPLETLDGVEIIRVPVLNRTDAAAASLTSMACYLPMAWSEGRRLLRGRQFDLINTHFVVPTGPVGQSLADFAGIPNVLTVHGGDLYDPSKSMSPHRHGALRILIRRLLKRAASVVGQSQNTIDNVHEFYLPDLTCELIPLGIERPAETVMFRDALGLGESERVLVTIGRLVGRKANEQLVQMLKDLDDPQIRLVIIGDGPERAMLEALAAELGVAAQVTFAGFVDEPRKQALLRAADLYVSASQHEGFGLVYVEAMAAGLPVVCYDHGGHTDFLEDGCTGGVVRLNDLAALTRSCRQLLDEPDRQAQAGRENLARAERFFIDQCAREYLALFERTVAGFSGR